MSAARSQRKGKAGELECRRLFEAEGLRVMATGSFQHGAEVLPDLLVTPPAGARVGVEVKRAKMWRMREWLDQLDSQRRARPDNVGCLMMRRDQDRRWVVATYWEDLQELARSLRAPR